MADKKLEVKDLKITFKTDNGLVQAVRTVSFDLYEGETLCIVGESGSGKSVTSKAIMGILPRNAIVEQGSIIYEGENLLDVSEEEFHKIRGHKIGMIFQDPLSSLNPIMRIGKQITEATLVNANKLKQKYDDLISKELMQYKNAIAHKNIEISKLKDKLELFKNEVKTKKKSATAEEKLKLNASLKETKEEYNTKVKLLKEEYSSKAPTLKQALKERKAKAKTEMAEYKSKLRADYENEIARIKEKAASALSSQGANVEAIEKDSKQKLEKAKINYIDKTRITRAEAKRRALEIMSEVGIPFPEKRYKQYPFEFSGGMRQRIVIAIALTANPDVLICDEPTTALDVTIQAQILELINRLKRDRNLSCVFITHDLGVVANMADRVAVMYAGKIVEYGKVDEIFFEPKHPYTWALLSSIPDVDSKERLEAIPGTPPDMIYPPKGDAFALRSRYAMEIDYKYQPPFYKVSETHYAATWLLHPDAPQVEMPKIVSERIKTALGKETAPKENDEELNKVVAAMIPKKKTTRKKVKEDTSNE